MAPPVAPTLPPLRGGPLSPPHGGEGDPGALPPPQAEEGWGGGFRHHRRGGALSATLIALAAVAAAYFALPPPALDDICDLLASGKNVVSTAVTPLIYPASMGPKVVDRLEKACVEGGTTFHATGIEPGWGSECLPMAMSGIFDVSVMEYAARLPHTLTPVPAGRGRLP